MRRLSLVVAAAAVLTTLAGCKKSGPAEGASSSMVSKVTSAASNLMMGKEELLRSVEAVKSAKSWREKMVMEQAGKSMEVLVEVSCPDREHTTSIMGGRSFESVHVGDASWTRIGGQWMSMPATRTALSACGTGSLKSDKSPVDPMAALDKAKITPGGLTTVEGSPCQEYQITTSMPAEGGGTRDVTYDYCVGVTDHLPRQMKAEGMTITWSDWNQPMNISPPM